MSAHLPPLPDWVGRLGAPRIVESEPRYQQAVMPLSGGELRMSPLWHLDGVAWHDVPPPQRRGHQHVPQTVAFLSLFEEVWRCPCSAITRRGDHGWLNMEERYAPELNMEERYAPEPAPSERARSWVARLLRRHQGGTS